LVIWTREILIRAFSCSVQPVPTADAAAAGSASGGVPEAFFERLGGDVFVGWSDPDHDDVGSQGISKCSTGKAKKECVVDTQFVVSPARNDEDYAIPQFERYIAI
jgi:hypothetical protein